MGVAVASGGRVVGIVGIAGFASAAEELLQAASTNKKMSRKSYCFFIWFLLMNMGTCQLCLFILLYIKLFL
jgi:hypothetical protein